MNEAIVIQAHLPELQTGVPVNCEEWEELCWKPGVTVDADLVMFLRAARSMAVRNMQICS